MSKLSKIPAITISWLILSLRPLFGSAGCCKYSPSCSQYAQQALNKYSLPKACWLSLKRLLNCW